jgi:hypothetical protein
LNAEWKQIKKNNELIQQKIQEYSTKQKINLAKNTLLIWTKESNVNLSTNSNDIILDESISSTSSTKTTNSIITNDADNNPTIKKLQKNH